jgi:hypothetical protein
MPKTMIPYRNAAEFERHIARVQADIDSPIKPKERPGRHARRKPIRDRHSIPEGET